MSIGEGLPTARKFQEISCIALLHITNDLLTKSNITFFCNAVCTKKLELIEQNGDQNFL